MNYKNLIFEEYRFNTFRKKTNKYKMLAAAGFYCKNDIIYSFCCNKVYKNDKYNNGPYFVHKYSTPDCIFFCNNVLNKPFRDPEENDNIISDLNITYDMDNENSFFTRILLNNPKYPNYSDLNNRNKTFKDSKINNKTNLVKNGFFLNHENNKLTCFYCGIELTNYKFNDDIVFKHSYLNNIKNISCNFLKLHLINNYNLGDKIYLEKREFNKSGLCICNLNPVNTILFPCMHNLYCNICSKEISNCPKCNVIIIDRIIQIL